MTMRTAHARTCPIAKVADLIGDTAMLLIVRDLLSGPKRFGDLEGSLFGVSTRTLTKRLKALEECGLVKRAMFAERPPRVEYTLTKKGRGLGAIARAMREYGEAHL
ncbi:helix-turn-helix transcriptional regulator [Patescibacteria group bacterium]|nr:helix-turn-helix transcriptional regulator [Patescibacteria group bacterium]